MTLRFRAVILGIMAFALGVLFLVSSVSAQGTFDKFKEGLEDIRPKGELFRKIFGNKEDDKKGDKAADSQKPGLHNERSQPANADPRMAAEMQRRAVLAQQQRLSQQQQQQHHTSSRMQQPTLAPQQSASPQRYPTGRRTGQPSATRNAEYHGLTPPPLPPQPQLMDGGNAPTIAVAQPVVEPMALQSQGEKIDLGIVIRATGTGEQAKGLLIEKIDDRGFGAKSGLRKGDLIIGIGGIEARNKDDFNSIADVMRAGDQIEFEVNRKGKSEKIIVQFGESTDSENDLEFKPSPTQDGAGGSIGDLNMDLSHTAPVDHVAFLLPGSEALQSSAGTGKLRSVLVNEPWPNAPTSRNRR